MVIFKKNIVMYSKRTNKLIIFKLTILTNEFFIMRQSDKETKYANLLF